MGCDIHFWVEKKVDGKWVTAEDEVMTPCESCSGTGINDFNNLQCFRCDGVGKKDSLDYSDRSYSIFSILANVRNKKEGECGYLTPISEPRGIPQDSRVFEIYNQDREWGHSGSTHTLKQLKEYDWYKRVAGGMYDGNTHADAGAQFYYKTIPALEKLARIYGGTENVRIVFFFDN